MGEKLENAVLDSETLNDQEKMGAETVEIESVKDDELQNCNRSSSSSDNESDCDESDCEKDKELDKPLESTADLPETNGNEVVAIVEIPIENSGAIEEGKEGTPPEVEDGFSSPAMSSIELAKEAIMEVVNQSDFVSLVKSTKEEFTEALASVPFTEVQQEVEKLAVTVESATKSDDGVETKDTTKVKDFTTWKSCCGMFKFFFTGINGVVCQLGSFGRFD